MTKLYLDDYFDILKVLSKKNYKGYLHLIFAFILSFAFLISCSSARKIKYEGEIKSLPVLNKNLSNISIKGIIGFTYNGKNQSTDCKLLLAKTDSLSLTIIGPFGMTLARLYAKPDYFLFYNAYNNDALEGSPNPSQLSKVFFIPIDYSDFVTLSRYDIIGNPDDYKILTSFKDDNFVIFKNSKNTDYNEYYLVAKDDYTIRQYQRKNREDILLFSASYQDIQFKEGYYFPEKIEFSFPTMQAGLTIECNKVIFNENYDKPFSINLPSDIIKRRLED